MFVQFVFGLTQSSVSSVMEQRGIILVMLLLFGLSSAHDDLDPNYKYCLSYTWLGPSYTDTTEEPMKCDDYVAKFGNGTAMPCVDPIIFSNDTISRPNFTELWEANKTAIACRKSDTQSCVIYTVSFKGLISYQTYMCTRVRTNSEIIKSGCLTEKKNNQDVEVCVCEGSKGTDLPCNGATTYAIAAYVVLLGTLINWIARFFL